MNGTGVPAGSSPERPPGFKSSRVAFSPRQLSFWTGVGKPLVLDFARQFLPNDIDEVRRIFSGKGAYARFKNLLDRRGALDHWYDFEAKVEEKALRMWCDLNSIEFGD